jgi:hypothetical protein
MQFNSLYDLKQRDVYMKELSLWELSPTNCCLAYQQLILLEFLELLLWEELLSLMLKNQMI